MIRRLSCAAVWLLLLLAILVSPGSSAQLGSYDCPFCSIKLWDADISAGVPATFAYNNLWNTRGARGFQRVTAYDGTSPSDPLWSTTWDWKRGQGYTVTSYVSTVSGWHWGETYKLVTPPEPFETEGLIPQPGPLLSPPTRSSVIPIKSTVEYVYEPNAACSGKRAIICRYDVAYDLWFHDHVPHGGDTPTFELMVWLSYSWDDLWIGYTPIATGINIAGREWKIFHTASTNAVFVPAERFSDLTPVTFTLSLDQFINAAIEHVPGFSTDWYLSSVEFGIEVYQGKGTFKVNRYDLTIGL
jgi:hypothetical protein